MKQKFMRVLCAVALVTSCFGNFATTSAQEKVSVRTTQNKATADKDVVLEVTSDTSGTFTFIAADNMFGGQLVKGVPYSAQAVTENIQTLSDGNRIVRKNTSAIYRDGEGRTRQEQTFGAIGPYAAAGDPPKTFFINDPVAGVHYVLEPNSKIARKMTVPTGGEMTFERKVAPEGAGVAAGGATVWMREERPMPPPAAGGDHVFFSSVEGGPIRVHSAGKASNIKTETLSKQNIEGVEAEGTRTTLTIPAGEIGNEQPINVTTEVWFSPELKVVVLRKHSDPRNGEMIYRLTNINRAEPDHSLFEVPSDYQIKEAVSPRMKMKLEQEILREKTKIKEKNDQ